MLLKIAKQTFKTTLPISKKEIKFRPFLNSEQKVLLIAKESNNSADILNAVSTIIEACIEEPIKVSSLTQTDFEWLFLQLRIKSVSNVSTLRFSGLQNTDCDMCRLDKNVNISLDDITVPLSNIDDKIFLTEEFGVKMRFPTLEILEKNYSSLELIAHCIEYTFDEKEVYHINDEQIEELIKWLDELPLEMFSKLERFLTSCPKLSHVIDLTCPKCGKEEVLTIEGLSSFFL
jgi:hypothetical protein